MAKKIKIVAEVDASGVSRGLKVMEDAAQKSSGKMTKTLYEYQKYGGLTQSQIQARADYTARIEAKAAGAAARKAQVELANQTAAIGAVGARGRFGVASSMFVSAARDTAASLASGAPITQVIAQQAPQVIQGLSMMKLGMVALKVTAVAAGAAVTGYLLKSIADSYIGTDKLKKSFEDLAHATEVYGQKIALQYQKRTIAAEAAAADLAIRVTAQNYDRQALSAAQELAEQKAIAAFWAEKGLRTKEAELELERRLLLMREQQAKLDVVEAEKNLKNKAAKAEALAEVKSIEEQIAADDRARKNAIEKAKTENPIIAEYKRVGNAAATGSGFTLMPTGRFTPESEEAQARAVQKIELETAAKKLEFQEKLRQAQMKLLEATTRPNADLPSAKAHLASIQNQLSALSGGASASLKSNRAALYSGDALTNVGNFLGAGGGVINSIQQQQLDEAKRLTLEVQKSNKHLQEIANKSAGAGGTIDIR